MQWGFCLSVFRLFRFTLDFSIICIAYTCICRSCTRLRLRIISPKATSEKLKKQNSVRYYCKPSHYKSVLSPIEGRVKSVIMFALYLESLKNRHTIIPIATRRGCGIVKERVNDGRGYCKSVQKGTKRFPQENLGSHPHQDFESKTEQRQRAGIRPGLGQPFSHLGDQGAKWKFFSDVTNIYDVRWGCPSLDNISSQQ